MVGGLGMGLGGGRLAGYAGLGVLCEFCGVIGLGRALLKVLSYRGSGEAVFDRGVAMVWMLLVAVGGGEACIDIEFLRAEPDVFGVVPSTPLRCTGHSPVWMLNGLGLPRIWAISPT